jgi:glycolate oxidase FAD binding subunit
VVAPSTPAELAQALHDAASHQRTIALAGNSSKHLMAGPNEPADVEITTSALRRELQYEPHDLTISVEAGMRWRDFTARIAGNRQMVPPWAE